MKIIITDDIGNVVVEKEFSKEERSFSLSIDNDQLKLQSQAADQTNVIGCYH